MAGVEVVVVEDDGAPRGARDFVMWNPPFVDRVTAKLIVGLVIVARTFRWE